MRLAAFAPCDDVGVDLRDQEKNHRHGQQYGGINLGDALPADRKQDEWRTEVGDRGAHVAHAENAERRALPFRFVPAGYVCNADCERAVCQSDTECRHEKQSVGFDEGEQQGGDRRSHHQDGKDEPPAKLVRPNSEQESAERSGQNRRCDQDPELGIAEAEILLYLDADDRKDRPDREAYGESQCAEPEGALLIAFGYVFQMLHRIRVLLHARHLAGTLTARIQET